MKMRPLHDRVLVLRIEEEETTAGGIIIPDSAKEKPQQGKVLAVGPGERDEDGKRIPMDVNVGDTVVFAKYAGTGFKTEDGEEILILKENDILAVLT